MSRYLLGTSSRERGLCRVSLLLPAFKFTGFTHQIINESLPIFLDSVVRFPV